MYRRFSFSNSLHKVQKNCCRHMTPWLASVQNNAIVEDTKQIVRDRETRGRGRGPIHAARSYRQPSTNAALKHIQAFEGRRAFNTWALYGVD